MTIPWLAVGPGIPQGVTLTSHINIYDTAATAAYALNLPIPDRWDGRPVPELFGMPASDSNRHNCRIIEKLPSAKIEIK
jgi:hypothetical protein